MHITVLMNLNDHITYLGSVCQIYAQHVQGLTHFILITTLERVYYYFPHVTEDKTEARRSEVTCSKVHRHRMADLRFKFRSGWCRAHVLNYNIIPAQRTWGKSAPFACSLWGMHTPSASAYQKCSVGSQKQHYTKWQKICRWVAAHLPCLY